MINSKRIDPMIISQSIHYNQKGMFVLMKITGENLHLIFDLAVSSSA